jgi:2-hydroxy-6-oxonona-2,4-dienedioate hydrolase
MTGRAAFESTWADVRYGSLTYRIHSTRSQTSTGESPPLIFIPGLGCSGRSMLPTARLLTHMGQVFIIDLPGHGESADATDILDLQTYAAVLGAWLEAAEFDRAVWIGHSFGAQVLVELALARPEAVAQLALISLTVDPRARSMAAQFARLVVDSTREPPALLRVLCRDYLQTGLLTVFRNGRLAIGDPVEQKLPAIGRDTLIVCGARDPLVPRRWAEEIVSLLPHAELAVVPGAPHAVQYAAAPAVAELIDTFIGGRDDSRPAPHARP